MVRFDKPCSLVRGAVEYFREHMQLGDYLTEEGQVEMTWVGTGAEQLGLSGVCRTDEFERLCRGHHPVSDDKLMVRDKGAHRRVCYFGQVSPPKDVSILYLVGGDKRIGTWWDEAVRETLTEIEGVTSTRVRRGGLNEDRITGSMIAAIVTHDASRALDPQLHTHLCIMNLTFDPVEQRWKGVQPSAYFRHQGYFREVCYNRLARSLLIAGYELELVRGIGFNVKGVPPELRSRFSKRRRTILERAAVLGATSQDALQTLAGQTRAAKTHSTAKDLRRGWLQEAGAELPALRRAMTLARDSQSSPDVISSEAAIKSAEAHVFERRSVADEHLLLREALLMGRGKVSLKDLKVSLGKRVLSGELIKSGQDIASSDGLASEEEFTAWASRATPTGSRWGQVHELGNLSEDQTKAVKGVLASTQQVLILQGDAGTGKTTSLKVIVAGIEAAGGHVFGCAPSSGAADVLRQELTADADTLQQLLVNRSLQTAIKNRVIIVDEAGLVSVREMRDLCRLAAVNGNRLLLVGDTKQHSSVEAGDSLRCLQRYAEVPVFRLREIHRQYNPDYRKAVGYLAQGKAFEAFNQLDRLGAVKEIADLPMMFRAAAEDYVQTVKRGKSCLAISPVWSEIHSFTDAVRDYLKASGSLIGEEHNIATVHSLKWTREERRRTENYQAGDLITFHRENEIFRKHEIITVMRQEGKALLIQSGIGEVMTFDPRQVSGYDVGLAREISVAVGDQLMIRANLKPENLRNGDLVKVAEFHEDGGMALSDGRRIPSWFREFSHGYATTSHAAQGKTVDHGILLMADAGISSGNLKQAYVSNSRFREDQMIFTSDRRLAREAMMRPADRKLALEMVEAGSKDRADEVSPAVRISNPQVISSGGAD